LFEQSPVSRRSGTTDAEESRTGSPRVIILGRKEAATKPGKSLEAGTGNSRTLLGVSDNLATDISD